ncbi:MAG: PQQ-binding-like beta-propeller repeat protein, partial [Opitutae bacterium]|nr:PQQ-binding-like beta-propeller repeat protein [Opitutae bacterium]
YDVGAGIIASPAVASGMVFIGDEKGNLFAFGK